MQTVELNNLQNYRLIRILSKKLNTITYLASSLATAQSVCIKIAPVDLNSREAFSNLELEYHFSSRLLGPHILTAYELILSKESMALVYENFAGVGLDTCFPRPMEILDFLELAIAMVKLVEDLHLQGLIHQWICPANFLIEPQSKTLKISNFTRACFLSEQTKSWRQLSAKDDFEYISPEQSGRLSSSVDFRTDLYSLGLCFYELLTGRKAFTATDPLAWIYCHLAKQAPAPSHILPSIPDSLSTIIMKLLEKAPENRYQSSPGLLSDLEKCLEYWSIQQSIPSFALALKDICPQLRLPRKIFGRECEIEHMNSVYSKMQHEGRPTLLLVSGYSGVGKTSFVSEIQKHMIRHNGFYACGKYDQYQHGIPYACLSQALKDLIQQILALPEGERSQWRKNILAALGPNGQLLEEIVSDLSLLIGKQPPPPPLALSEAETRLHLLIQNFLQLFASHQHPLVIFLDDLQWLDSAILQLMRKLVSPDGVKHLLLIGAYRGNEVSEDHPVLGVVRSLKQSGSAIEEIELHPLALPSVTQFIGEALQINDGSLEPFAKLVFLKTQGNPFFIVQYLRALYQDSLLVYDASNKRWTWDLEQINSSQFSDDVADFMIKRFEHFPVDTLNVLAFIACLGNEGPLNTIAAAMNMQIDTLHRALLPLVNDGLLEITGRHYKFAHDRIQQAAYMRIAKERQMEIHLALGIQLLKEMDESDLEHQIFSVVSQWNKALPLIDGDAERQQSARLNLLAGKRAKSSAAYKAASEYFARGIEVISPPDWDAHHRTLVELYLGQASCEQLGGNFERAKVFLKELLAHSPRFEDRGRVYLAEIELYTAQGEMKKAIESCVACALELGIELIPNPSQEEVQKEFNKIWQRLGKRSIESLVDLPLMADSDQRLLMNVLASTIPVAIFTEQNIFNLLLCLIVNKTLEHGTTEAAAVAYVYFGMILGPSFNRYRDAYRFGKVACELVETHKLLRAKSPVYFLFGDVLNFWFHHLSTNLPYIHQAFQSAVEIGDITSACYCSNHLISCYLALGEPLDKVMEETESSIKYVRSTNFKDISDILISMRQFVQNMRGETLHFDTFNEGAFIEEEFESKIKSSQMALVIFWYNALKIQARFLSGNYSQAVELGEQSAAMVWSSPSHTQVVEYTFYYSLALAACVPKVSAELQSKYMLVLTQNLEQFKHWNELCKDNFLVKYALISAEMNRVKGDHTLAQDFYEIAIEAAGTYKFLQLEALAHELAAAFYRERRLRTPAAAHLQLAKKFYGLWNAHGKVRQLERLFPDSSIPLQMRSEMQVRPQANHIDFIAVAKAALAISRETQREKLIQLLMRLVIEIAGAEKAMLFLLHDSELFLEAETSLTSSECLFQEKKLWSESMQLSATAIKAVMANHELMILNNAALDPRFEADRHVVSTPVRSLCCLPILKQSTLVGILYLENNLLAGSFTPDRVNSLDLISTLALISLENALFLNREKVARLEAEHSNQLKDDFLITLSHELRTPLNAIIGWTSRLQKGLVVAHDIPKALETIYRNARNEAQLVEDLLDISAIVKQDLNLNVTSLRLSELICEAVDATQVAAVIKHLQVHCELEENTEIFRGDRKRLIQVFTNLLNNAIKFTPECGSIEISFKQEASQAVIAIKDSGIGISPEFLPYLFERFRQANSTTVRRYEGMGIGLSLARSLVEAHGGSIIAASPGLDQGATFTVYLPQRPEEPSAFVNNSRSILHPIPVTDSYNFSGVRILVVEDALDTRFLIRVILEEYQATIETAGSVKEALHVFQNFKPNIIISDIGLPDQDGYALIREIRSIDQRSGNYTPTIALTAYARNEDRERAEKSGFDLYLSKPIEPEALLGHVAFFV